MSVLQGKERSIFIFKMKESSWNWMDALPSNLLMKYLMIVLKKNEINSDRENDEFDFNQDNL